MCLLTSSFHIQVQIPGLEELQVFVPCGLMDQRPLILQLLNAAAGKDCSKEPDEIAEDEAYLLMSKHGAGDSATDSGWAQWDGELLKLVPQMETVDTLRAMKVRGVTWRDVTWCDICVGPSSVYKLVSCPMCF